MGLLRENRICPFVFERLKIRLNIVYCCEELPLSTDAEVTHRVLHPAARLRLFRYCPWGWLFAGDQSKSLLWITSSEIQRNEESGSSWSFSSYCFKHSGLLVVLCWFWTKKKKRVDSSLFVRVSLMLFEELIYRGVILILLIYHTEDLIKMPRNSVRKLVFTSCIPFLCLAVVLLVCTVLLRFWVCHRLGLPFWSLVLKSSLINNVRGTVWIFSCILNGRWVWNVIDRSFNVSVLSCLKWCGDSWNTFVTCYW